MKNLRFLMLFTPLLLAFQCDDDPSDDTPPGTWSLVNVTGSIAGVQHTFPQGLITWKFGPTSPGSVTVVNNNTDDSLEDFFDTGTYDFDYIDNEVSNACEHTIEIHGMDFGCQDIEGNTMTFTQQAADGYILTFRKI